MADKRRGSRIAVAGSAHGLAEPRVARTVRRWPRSVPAALLPAPGAMGTARHRRDLPVFARPMHVKPIGCALRGWYEGVAHHFSGGGAIRPRRTRLMLRLGPAGAPSRGQWKCRNEWPSRLFPAFPCAYETKRVLSSPAPSS